MTMAIIYDCTERESESPEIEIIEANLNGTNILKWPGLASDDFIQEMKNVALKFYNFKKAKGKNNTENYL